ncbi:MAG: ribonuclease E/G [Planctomycetota bacterium]
MKRILINVTEPLESRLAVISQSNAVPMLHRGTNYLEEFYLERASQETLVGNIYLGRVVNIQPNLQAAFIDIGLEKNGFLHLSETLIPPPPLVGQARKKKTDIRDVLEINKPVIVQIIRDGIKAKGPSLTIDISLPGRYLILRPYPPPRCNIGEQAPITSGQAGSPPMAGQAGHITISRKISGTDERIRLKKLLQMLNPPSDFSFIIRTASGLVDFKDLEKDLLFLTTLWRIISQRLAPMSSELVKTTDAAGLIYQESDLVIRTLRDIFSPLVKEILVDSELVFNKVTDFFRSTMPRYQNLVKLYRGSRPIFDAFNIESQVKQVYEREIKLPSGGSIVIEPTEALVSIDVNSGQFRKNVPPEELAFRTNLEAAREITHQLRLRDLGGVIVIDFIEMKNKNHSQQVEKTIKDELKKDRSKTTVSRISRLGLMEIARQKIGPGKMLIPYTNCPTCNGTGLVKSIETIGLEVLRQLKSYHPRKNAGLTVNVSEPVGNFLEQPEIKKIFAAWAKNSQADIVIKKHSHFNLEKIEINCYNNII